MLWWAVTIVSRHVRFPQKERTNKGKDEGPKRAGHAAGSETALLPLDSETDWTSEGVQSGRDGKGNHPRSHNLETGAGPHRTTSYQLGKRRFVGETSSLSPL